MSSRRVIVVGAGLAGLVAADALQRVGAEVVVFEARDRVGGRVWSSAFPGDVVIERGAEFVLPGNTEVAALAARLGLMLFRKGTKYGDREPRGGEPVSREELSAALARIGAAPRGRAASVAERLAELGIGTAVREAIAARIEVSNVYPADDLEAAVLGEAATGFGDFDTQSVAGGNDLLAKRLAAGLDVRRGTPVDAVAWAAEGVRVAAGGAQADADAAVIAVPASVIDRIAFDPPLPERKAAALSGVRYGQAAKLFVGLTAPVPPSATLSVPERFWCYTQLRPDGAPAPLVSAFAGTAAAVRELTAGGGPQRWIERLASLRPDLALATETAQMVSWADDPWARGAYSARSLSSPLDDEELVRPVGPLVFAGEHTAGRWHGLMEGAVRSGMRAAEQLSV